MIVVIVCNFCKLIVTGYISWKRPPEPLVTIGDAVASFLDEPDLTTKGNCLAEKRRFDRMIPKAYLPLAKYWASRTQNITANGKCRRCGQTYHNRDPISYFDLRDFIDRSQHEPVFRTNHECAAEYRDVDDFDSWDEKPMEYDPRIRHWFSATSGWSKLVGLLL